jgi:hypothetical protein
MASCEPSIVRLGALSFAEPVESFPLAERPRTFPAGLWIGGAVMVETDQDAEAWIDYVSLDEAWTAESARWCPSPDTVPFGRCRTHLEALAGLCQNGRNQDTVTNAYCHGFKLAESVGARAPRLYALAAAGGAAGLWSTEAGSVDHNGPCGEQVRHNRQVYNIPPVVAAACRRHQLHGANALAPLCEGRCHAQDLRYIAADTTVLEDVADEVREWCCTVLGRVLGTALEETMNRQEYHEADTFTVPVAVRNAARSGLMLQRIHGVKVTEGQIRAGRRLLHGAVSYSVLRGLASTQIPRCGLSEDHPTPGFIAYMLRGGRAGVNWAKRMVEERSAKR